MVPKSSRRSSGPRSSQRSSQTTALLSTALDNLCKQLHKATRQQGDIRGQSDITNPMKEALRACRLSKTTIGASFIARIVIELDQNGHEICSRLEASVYSIIVQIILQADCCRENERVLYLLAASLYYDSREEDVNTRAISKKKDHIGKECLHLLLEFFVDEAKNDGMRRWVGILYLQLLEGCDENLSKVEMCSEDIRRKLGDLVLMEQSEVIRIICGYLIRSMLKGEIAPEHLWPIGYDKKLYENFPLSTQTNAGWNKRFHEYVDRTWESMAENQIPQTAGQLYFAQNVEIGLNAIFFGSMGHNVDLALEFDSLIFWAPATSDIKRFEQVLEIPLQSIKKITIQPKERSQIPSDLVDACLELDNNKDVFCYVDCVGTVLTQITMDMNFEDIKELAKELCALELDIEFINEYPKESDSTDQDSEELEGNPSSGAVDPMRFGVNELDPDFDGIREGAEESQPAGDATQESNISSASQAVALVNCDEDVDEGPSESECPKKIGPGDATSRTIPETQIDDRAVERIPLGFDGSEEWHNEGDAILFNDEEVKGAIATFSQANKSGGKNSTVKSQPRSANGPRPKAKQPLVQSQRSRKNLVRYPLDSEEPAPSGAEQPLTKAREVVSARGQDTPDLDQTEESILSLGRKFPTVHSPTLRGALTASDGNVTEAARLLQKNKEVIPTAIDTKVKGKRAMNEKVQSEGSTIISTAKTHNKSRPSKDRVGSGSESMTSPEANDASTPKECRVKEKSASRHPAMESQNRPTAGGTLKKNPKYTLKPKPQLYASASVPNSHFDIPADKDSNFGEAPTKAKKGPKAAEKSRKSLHTANKGTTNVTKSTKTDEKKRQSAPVVLQSAAPIKRSQRSAAARASQKLLGADASDEELEEEAAKVEKPKPTRKGKKDTSQTVSQPAMEPKPDEKTDNTAGSGKDDHLDNLQLQDARSLRLVKEGQTAEDDLYGASPRRPSQKPNTSTIVVATTKISEKKTPQATKENNISIDEEKTSQAAVNKKSKCNGDMASGLAEMLSDLEEDEEPAEKQLPNSTTTSVRRTPLLQSDGHGEVLLEKVTSARVEDTQIHASRKSLVTQKEEPGTGEMAPPTLKQLDGKKVVKNDIAVKDVSLKVQGVTTSQPLSNPSDFAVESIIDLTNEHTTDESSQNSADTGSVDIDMDNDVEDGNNDPVKKDYTEEQAEKRSDPSMKKRKSPMTAETASKRAKSHQLTSQYKQAPASASPQNHQGPQMQGHTNAEKQQHTKPTSLQRRRSPRFAAAQNASTQLVHDNSEKVLVDEHQARKQPIISFGAKGARNQGPSSALKGSVHRTQAIEKADTPTLVKPLNHKRKREKAETKETDAPVDASPPRKRQSTSPRIDDDLVIYPSSPPAAPEVEKTVASNPPPYHEQPKQGSQSSRVDENGSPMAPASAPQIDHIGKVQRKLFDESPPAMPVEMPPQENGVADGQKSPMIFGPKLILGSIPKARPSSPEEIVPRYIPHKSRNGLYEDVGTKEVVAPEKDLADPFVEKLARKSSGFTDRLLAGSVKTTNKHSTKFRAQVHTIEHQAAEDVVKLPPHPAKLPLQTASKTNENRLYSKKAIRPSIEDPEKTLVDSENQQPSDDTSSSGSSDESHLNHRSSSAPTQIDEFATQEEWNVALRPHYKTAYDAIHRIADEVIIRLSNEEQAMGRLVTQYEENGTKLLDGVIRNRDIDKARVEKVLQCKKKELINIYNEAKGFVEMSKENVERSPIASFEKQWRKKQETIQEQLDEGRGVD